MQNSLDFNPAPFITLPRGVRMCQPTTRHIIHSPGLLAVATEIHTRYGCVCFLRRLEPALHLVLSADLAPTAACEPRPRPKPTMLCATAPCVASGGGRPG